MSESAKDTNLSLVIIHMDISKNCMKWVTEIEQCAIYYIL